MSFIAFLGCDGSGKSAVIEGVSAELGDAGIRLGHGHWRPVAFGRTEAVDRSDAADDPHGQIRRGPLSSLLKLGWLGIHWWVGWWRELRHQSRTGVLLFDRYHGDLVVDPQRYRYGGPAWLAKIASCWMPQPDLVIFLDASPAVLLSRKQEVSYEALEQARTRYLDWIGHHANCVKVDAERPLPDVVGDVLQRIMALQQEKSG